MNIKHIIDAVESLDQAIVATIDKTERETLQTINNTLRATLRKYGVFVGEPVWKVR